MPSALKPSPDKYVTHEQVLDALTAHGWIDGIRRRINDQRTRQLISPRRVQPWAKTYKHRAERLIATGRMHPAGQATVDLARHTGAWHAMDDVDALRIPDDLAAALSTAPPAAEHFAAFPPSTRRNILRWIASARTDATRQRRITTVADDANHGIRTQSNGERPTTQLRTKFWAGFERIEYRGLRSTGSSSVSTSQARNPVRKPERP